MPATRSPRTTSSHWQPPAVEPHVLNEWSGFAYEPVGIAPDLAAAQAWVNELRIGDDPAA
ncbi:hypothetical protein [Streptomyces sp. NBC_00829]|uniref:hypothetical protein n=1 Tax=Streptomyces sp. NBC_00829 TaxID=2903679 RepID=UPI00386B0963|nr:hypothetical protein OG293_20635 [Streptomyces sp. NBC_00829]